MNNSCRPSSSSSSPSAMHLLLFPLPSTASRPSLSLPPPPPSLPLSPLLMHNCTRRRLSAKRFPPLSPLPPSPCPITSSVTDTDENWPNAAKCGEIRIAADCQVIVVFWLISAHQSAGERKNKTRINRRKGSASPRALPAGSLAFDRCKFGHLFG